MLAYFPAVYPDELLYSVLARWLRHQGAVGMTQPLVQVFGRRLANASLELPGWIGHLAAVLPTERGLSAEALIGQQTLFPYYTAFVPEQLRSRCRQAMCAGSTTGWHLRLGLAAFRVGPIRRLRFCAACVEDMRRNLGELYWQRRHQLPGVMVCPEHGCALQHSGVQLHLRGRFEYVAATLRECRVDCDRAPVPGGTAHDRLWEVARRSAALLSHPGEPRDLAAWTQHYRQQMARSDLAWSCRRMKQAELLDTFHAFYDGALACLAVDCPGIERVDDWLPGMVRKHRKAAHPLQHLLLGIFLDNHAQSDGVFGAGPWPCGNPLAEHAGSLTVSAVVRHRNRGYDVGVFACPCGYVYTRRFNPARGELEAPRVRRFGPLFDAELRRQVEQGTSLRETARSLRVDPKTVARRAHELHLRVTWKDPAVARRPGDISTHAAVRAWAARAHIERPERLPRRNWRDIDDTFAEKIHTAADSIRTLEPPHRVTRAELERNLGNREWLSKRLRKLPKCTAALQGEAEDTATFHDRRIEWAVRTLYAGTSSVRLWRLAGRVGLTAAKLRERLAAFAAGQPQ